MDNFISKLNIYGLCAVKEFCRRRNSLVYEKVESINNSIVTFEGVDDAQTLFELVTSLDVVFTVDNPAVFINASGVDDATHILHPYIFDFFHISGTSQNKFSSEVCSFTGENISKFSEHLDKHSIYYDIHFPEWKFKRLFNKETADSDFLKLVIADISKFVTSPVMETFLQKLYKELFIEFERLVYYKKYF